MVTHTANVCIRPRCPPAWTGWESEGFTGAALVGDCDLTEAARPRQIEEDYIQADTEIK